VVDVLRPIVSCDRSRLPHARIPRATATPLASLAAGAVLTRSPRARPRTGGDPEDFDDGFGAPHDGPARTFVQRRAVS